MLRNHNHTLFTLVPDTSEIYGDAKFSAGEIRPVSQCAKLRAIFSNHICKWWVENREGVKWEKKLNSLTRLDSFRLLPA